MSNPDTDVPAPGRPVVLRGGTVLTMDDAHTILTDADVLVVGDRIAAVGTALDVPEGTQEIDARGGIVMPGMIDTHRHMWQTAMRGYGADWTLTQYFVWYYLEHGKAFRPEDVYAGNLVSAWDALEAGVTTTVDPLAGSYFVENLTDRIEAEALAYMSRIDELGGVLSAIEQGFVQGEIAEAAYRYQQEVDQKLRTVVGVNRFTVEEDDTGELYRHDATRERKQVEKLQALRARRDDAAASAAVARVVEVARGSENLMPAIVEAVRAYATVGEICHALRGVFGQYRGVVRF